MAEPTATTTTTPNYTLDALQKQMAYLQSPEYQTAQLAGLKQQFGEQRAQTLEDLAKFNVRGSEVAAPIEQMTRSQGNQLAQFQAGLNEKTLGLGVQAAQIQDENQKWLASFNASQEQNKQSSALNLANNFSTGVTYDAATGTYRNPDGTQATTIAQQNAQREQKVNDFNTLMTLAGKGVDVTAKLNALLPEIISGLGTVDFSSVVGRDQAGQMIDMINNAPDTVINPTEKLGLLAPWYAKLGISIPGYDAQGVPIATSDTEVSANGVTAPVQRTYAVPGTFSPTDPNKEVYRTQQTKYYGVDLQQTLDNDYSPVVQRLTEAVSALDHEAAGGNTSSSAVSAILHKVLIKVAAMGTQIESALTSNGTPLSNVNTYLTPPVTGDSLSGMTTNWHEDWGKWLVEKGFATYKNGSYTETGKLA